MPMPYYFVRSNSQLFNFPVGTVFTGPDPECDKKCANGGWCNHDKICQCPEGYMGQHCRTALCYPQCMNGGSCTSPGMCSCPSGFQGRHCEGGNYNYIFLELNDVVFNFPSIACKWHMAKRSLFTKINKNLKLSNHWKVRRSQVLQMRSDIQIAPRHPN
jgi:hypothetical protein